MGSNNTFTAIGELQPAYGVSIEPVVQPAYGVSIEPVVQPAYGVTYVGPDIDLSYEELEENISLLKSSISTLKESWNTETKSNISKLENSWAGKDCAEYTKKLSKMDKSVQNTISALELLCSTYEQARDMISQNQSTVVTAIRNI